jgi:hypothetical protein
MTQAPGTGRKLGNSGVEGHPRSCVLAYPGRSLAPALAGGNS